ncbi:M81 family metallopeptidase [Planosporangium thailandense]|uniref:M81 family metallopeptidase n=1 Tax=Planosporangium thailandense TaxID=765197 RepID=A0ABX0Y3I4_9ACTN|nr:M81 family metallopeptidase [Planosporangium thailandense]NJC72946.1 M81 family metallopeptidase [Planosporangium thailandense]
MRERLAVLGLGHETNTFSTVPADLRKYEDGGIHRGQALVDHYAESQATWAGFLAPRPDDPVETVPLLAAWINPCGAITREAFETIVDEMTERLAAALPVDGVLLGLHGAAVADGYPDADAEMAERVRAVVGPNVPIGAVLDMHANVSPRLVEHVDVLLPYQTNPHVDARARGIECRDRVVEIIRTGRRPALALEQLPLVVTITRQDTREEPMRGLLEYERRLEQRDGVLDVSVVEGFPYADVPQMGMSVLAAHRDGPAAARRVAREMAERVWAAREALQGDGVTVEDAIARIAAHRGDKPLLVLDVGDNVGGGGPGDSTVLLAAAVREKVGGIVVVLLDPQAVESLADRAVGDRVRIAVGGRSVEQDGAPVDLDAVLVGRSDGRYEEPTMAHGGLRYFDAGPMVALRTDDRITVVLTSKLVQPITPRQLTAVGLDPGSFRAITAKGVNGPRAGYADACGDLVVVDTPGVTRLSVQGFTYANRRRPMYPYEPDATYEPAPAPDDKEN